MQSQEEYQYQAEQEAQGLAEQEANARNAYNLDQQYEEDQRKVLSTRVGNFSSSNIWKLMTTDKSGKNFGKPALTYIEEKKMEIRLGRQLQNEVNSHETSWGNLVEQRAFDLLPLGYRLESKVRLVHPTIERWTGAPDLANDTTTGDVKCPFTLKSFCTMVDLFNDLEKFKEEKPEYYWQLVSNSILANKDCAELVVYVPYKSELQEIRELANNFDGDQNKIAWVNWANDNDLPYLIEDGHYKNLNTLTFKVDEYDKVALTQAVEMAIKLLLPVLPDQKYIDEANRLLENKEFIAECDKKMKELEYKEKIEQGKKLQKLTSK